MALVVLEQLDVRVLVAVVSVFVVVLLQHHLLLVVVVADSDFHLPDSRKDLTTTSDWEPQPRKTENYWTTRDHFPFGDPSCSLHRPILHRSKFLATVFEDVPYPRHDGDNELPF